MNLATETIIVGGKTVKKKLLFALLGGFVFLGSLLGVFGITGVAAAVPIVGDFTVAFDRMDGVGFKLYGSVADSALQQNVPVAVNEIDQATITGLKIIKEVPALGVRVVISSSKPVEITGLLQKATDIEGDATFKQLAMAEKYIGDRNLADPATFAQALSEEFTQTAPNVTILNGSIRTLYLFQKTVSLNGMHVYFEKLN